MALQEDLICGEGGSTGSTILGRINLNHAQAGDLDLLITTSKDTLVNAINEVGTNIQKFYGVKASAYAVPDDYGTDAVTLNATGLVAGRYLISYSFQADFGTNRDKVLAFKLTGDQAGDEFGKTISTAHQEEKLSHNYSYYKDLPAGDLSYGIVFKDVTGGLGFVVDYLDLMVMYVGPTP